MGDPTHLEKMGRELNCPICLSLLTSAVSLTCNHVFCNSCIMKSMKSDSNCPVCKVPYRRREVRSAPHMDNLVSIYKSMEIASGFNIFVTQNPTKLSDEHKQGGDDANGGREYNDRIFQDTLGKQLILQKQCSGKIHKSNTESSAPFTSRPSFPTKKRIQVPQSTLSGTLEMNEKLEFGSRERKGEGFKTGSEPLRKKSVVNQKGKPELSPFFWLRDEDEEKLSQHTNEDQLLDITPPSIPTFSDIRDSDDENPSKSFPTGTGCGKSNVADLFDSEMFEWTQRACSPELYLSPPKMQVLSTTDMDAIKESKSEASPLNANTNEYMVQSKACFDTRPPRGTSDVVLNNLCSQRLKSANNQIVHNKSNTRGWKAREGTLRKCALENADRDSEVIVDSNTVPLETTQRVFVNEDCFSASEETGQWDQDGWLKRQNISSVSARETLDLGDENMGIELPDSFDKKQRGGDLRMKNGKVSSLKLKKRKFESIEINMIKEVYSTHNQKEKDGNAPGYYLSVPAVEDKNIFDIEEILGKHGEVVKHALSSDHNQELQCKENMEVSLDGILEDGLVNNHQEGPSNAFAKEAQSIETIPGIFTKAADSAKKVQFSLNTRVLDNSAQLGERYQANGVGMVKRKLNSKIQCAFCLSSEDSQAFGEMVHYYKGIPVAAEYNGGSSVIHSHKICAEWAPNVYFENDNAINLEAELARSRRIKCCCCGLKGAALGCCEKSCRKSFHVPCAKLITQCRWDQENFVMLCPTHAFSKFPNESLHSQERRKKRISKGQTPGQCNQVTLRGDISMLQSWKSCVTHEKLVLCCSALTIGEKEIVYEFEQLSGVKVLKNWDLSITHVIASADENGTCRRTLKVLKGIMEGKWIVNIEWVKACIKAMNLVEEEPYEITADIHGVRDGPRHGRLRVLNKQPKIFEGFKFYFMGDFMPYKGYIQDLLVTGGGTTLHRKPISEDHGTLSLGSSTPPTFIIYSVEIPDKCDPNKKDMLLKQRRSDAETLASSTGAKAVSNQWVLNSIAAGKLQNLAQK